MQFEHDGVSVSVEATVKPDAVFATITCAGTLDIADDVQLSDSEGTIGAGHDLTGQPRGTSQSECQVSPDRSWISSPGPHPPPLSETIRRPW